MSAAADTQQSTCHPVSSSRAVGRKWRAPRCRLMVCMAVMLVASGCRRPAPPAAPPPATVTVAHPVQQNVLEWDEYTGRLAAMQVIEVRARVGGLVVAVPFQEGGLVKAGELLAEIDARPYQAQLDARLAEVGEATAQARLADIDYRRIEAISAAAAVHPPRSVGCKDARRRRAGLVQSRDAGKQERPGAGHPARARTRRSVLDDHD